MSESVLVTDPTERAAVEAGEIDGDVYSDGEVYASLEALQAWRSRPRSIPDNAGAVPA